VKFRGLIFANLFRKKIRLILTVGSFAVALFLFSFLAVVKGAFGRGADIAGASTTIQSLMCLAHGMRRRTGDEGGYRALVFFDSIDKMRRLHGAYVDAEEGKELPALRITAFGDDANGQPRTQCCREPIGPADGVYRGLCSA